MKQRHSAARTPDAGTATAEFAMIVPALVVLIVVICGAATIGIGQLRAAEAARSAARELARGEPRAQVIAETRKDLGAAGSITITEDRGYTTVTVYIVMPHSVQFITKKVQSAATARTEGKNP